MSYGNVPLAVLKAALIAQARNGMRDSRVRDPGLDPNTSQDSVGGVGSFLPMLFSGGNGGTQSPPSQSAAPSGASVLPPTLNLLANAPQFSAAPDAATNEALLRSQLTGSNWAVNQLLPWQRRNTQIAGQLYGTDPATIPEGAPGGGATIPATPGLIEEQRRAAMEAPTHHQWHLRSWTDPRTGQVHHQNVVQDIFNALGALGESTNVGRLMSDVIQRPKFEAYESQQSARAQQISDLQKGAEEGTKQLGALSNLTYRPAMAAGRLEAGGAQEMNAQQKQVMAQIAFGNLSLKQLLAPSEIDLRTADANMANARAWALREGIPLGYARIEAEKQIANVMAQGHMDASHPIATLWSNMLDKNFGPSAATITGLPALQRTQPSVDQTPAKNKADMVNEINKIRGKGGQQQKQKGKGKLPPGFPQ